MLLDLTGYSVKDRAFAEATAAAREQAEFEALIAQLNDSGGIDGRKVEGKAFKYGYNDLVPDILLEGCIEITEDFGADYVIDTYVMYLPEVQQCFADHKVPIVTYAGGLTDKALRQYSPYVASMFPTLDRQFRAMVPLLEEVAYFDDGARVGVFMENNPLIEGPYKKILLPALKKAGVKPVSTASAHYTDNAGVANAVLKFQTAKVTHVIFISEVGGLGTFSNAAEAQGFRPRYAFGEYENGVGGYVFTGSPDQLANSVAVSVSDHFSGVADSNSRNGSDISSPIDVDAVSPGLAKCISDLSKATGRDYTNPGAAEGSHTWWHICSNWFLWVNAMKARKNTEPADFGKALIALGKSYQSAFIHHLDFRKFPQNGADQFAAGVYDRTCGCFVRQTDWQEIGK